MQLYRSDRVRRAFSVLIARARSRGAGGGGVADEPRSGGKLRSGIEPPAPEGDLVVCMSGQGSYERPYRPRLLILKSLIERSISSADRCHGGWHELLADASRLGFRVRYWTVAGSFFIGLVAAPLALVALM